MKIYIGLFLILSISLNIQGKGKIKKHKNKNSISIEFDANGKMIKFPPAVIRSNKILSFSVKTGLDLIDKQYKFFQEKLQKTKKAITGSKAKYYSCILGEKNLTNYISCLDLLIAKLKEPSVCKTDVRNWLVDKDDAFTYIPANVYFKQVFEKQFQIKIYSGQICLDSFDLHADFTTCPEKCVTFYGESSNKIKNLVGNTCYSCPNNRVQFQLIQHDPFNSTVVSWLQMQLSRNSFDAEEFMNDFKPIKDNFDVVNQCTDFERAIASIQKLNDWTLGWFWFTEGQITTNLFQKLPDLTQNLNSNLKEINKQLDFNHALMTFNDSSKTKLKSKNNNIHEYEILLKRGEKLSETIDQLSRKKKDLDKQLAEGTDNGKKYAITKNYLYAGEILLSKQFEVNVQKQFDAGNEYKPLYKNRRARERLHEIPENEKIAIVIHNLDSNVSVKVDEKRIDFNDIEDFTRFTMEELSKIDFSSISAPSLINLQNTLGDLINTQKGTKGAVLEKSEANKLENKKDSTKCNCADAYGSVKDIYNAFVNNTYTFPPADIFDVDQELKPRLSSLIRFTTPYEAPYRDSMTISTTIKKEQKDVAKTYIKVGKLRHVQIAAGMAFAVNPTSTTTIDTTGGGFKVSSTDNQAVAIVGFKVYPFKNYNRDGSIIPRYPLRRISFFGGFEIIHPLNNFYLGGAYDIVPGLAFSVGSNYYLQTNYKVQNNQVVNTSKSYKASGAYYAVTVNPTLFIQFVKLLFK